MSPPPHELRGGIFGMSGASLGFGDLRSAHLGGQAQASGTHKTCSCASLNARAEAEGAIARATCERCARPLSSDVAWIASGYGERRIRAATAQEAAERFVRLYAIQPGLRVGVETVEGPYYGQEFTALENYGAEPVKADGVAQAIGGAGGPWSNATFDRAAQQAHAKAVVGLLGDVASPPAATRARAALFAAASASTPAGQILALEDVARAVDELAEAALARSEGEAHARSPLVLSWCAVRGAMLEMADGIADPLPPRDDDGSINPHFAEALRDHARRLIFALDEWERLCAGAPPIEPVAPPAASPASTPERTQSPARTGDGEVAERIADLLKKTGPRP